MAIIIRFLLLILSFGVLLNKAEATVNVVKYGSGTPVQVCQASDSNPSCGGGGGGSTPGGTGTNLQYRAGASTFGGVTGSSVDSNNNVGLGTLAPGVTLDVQGTIRASTDVKIGTQSVCQANGTNCPGAISGFGNPTASVGLTAVNGSATTAMRSDGAPALNVTISPTWTGNHIFSPSSGNTVFTAGNVGVGSATPGQILDINGSARIRGTNSLFFGDTNVASINVDSATTVPNMIFKTDTNTGSPIERMRLNSVGNLGVGTNDPLALVHIGTGGDTPDIAGGTRLYVSNKGATQLEVRDSTNDVGFKFTAGPSSAVISSSSGTELLMSVNGSTGIRVSAGNNIGINSASPGQRLDVQGTSRMTGFQLNLAPLAGGNILVSGSTGIGTWMPASTLGFGTGTVTSIATTAPITGGTITTTGTLGITQSTTSTNGYLSSTDWNTFNNKVSSQWATQNTTDVSLAGGNVGVGTTITTTSALTVMNGNVGLGTWKPTAILSINGDVHFPAGNTRTISIDTSAASAGDDLAITAASSGSGSSLRGGDLIFTSGASLSGPTARGGNMYFSIAAGNPNGALLLGAKNDGTFKGNIGIGTSSANNSLLVIGNGGLNGGMSIGNAYEKFAAPSDGAIILGNVGIGTFAAGNGKLIVSGGNVGIGTVVPGTVLDVTGTTRTTGFQLNLAPLAGGNILVSNSVGVGTWMPTSTINAGSVTTNANLTGVITSVGNATSIAAQTGTGTTFVTQASPTLTTPVIGIATGTSLTTSGNIGIGTTFISTAALAVMGGNVGVGTWVPAAGLDIKTSGNATFSGNVGIGTTSPQSSLTLGGNAHMGSTGTAPTVASNDCGSTGQGTIVAGSTDLRGSVTVGTLTVTSCAVTFNVPFGRAPVCLTQDDTTILAVKNSQTTTKLTITSTTSMSSDVVAWVCIE